VRYITFALVIGYTLNAIIILIEVATNLNDSTELRLKVACTVCQIVPLCFVMGIHLKEMYYNR